MKSSLLRFFRPFGNNCLDLLFWEVVALCGFACVCDANFVFSDDNFVVRSICHGLFRKPGIMLSHGRFMPLQGLDVNLVLLFPASWRTNIPMMIYSFLAGLFVVSSYLFARVLKLSSDCVRKENSWVAVPFLMFLLFLISKDVLRDFWWNMLPESRIIFGLCVFWSAVLAMLKENRLSAQVLMVLSAIYVSLFKENAFMLPVGFACVVLAFGCRKLSIRNRVFFIAVIVYAMLFCVSYVVFIKPHVAVSYSAGRQIPLINAVRYFTCNPLFAVALILSFARFYFLVFKKSTEHLIWDAALFAGVAHVASYVLLRYQSEYYVTPAYVFVTPTICHWIVIGCESLGKAFYRVVILIAVLVIAHGADRSWSVWSRTNQARNSDVPGLVDLSKDTRLKTVFYFHPETGLFEESDKNIFNDFWKCYVKGGKVLEVKDRCPDFIDRSQAIIFPHAQKTAWKYIAIARRLRCHVVRMSNYDVVYGPVEFGPMRFSGGTLVIPEDDNGSCTGFYACEKWGRWGMSNATVTVSVDDAIVGKPIFARARLGALTTAKNPTNTVQVLANGREVCRFDVTRFQLTDRYFEITSNCNCGSRLDLAFVLPNGCVCPAEDGPSKDVRKLGVAFGGMELSISPIVERQILEHAPLPSTFNDLSGFSIQQQNGKKFTFIGGKNTSEAYLRFSVKDLKSQPSQLVIRFRARAGLMRHAYMRTAKSREGNCRVSGDVCEAVFDMRNCASWYWPSGFYYVGIGFPLKELQLGDEIELLSVGIIPFNGD